jgi:hypothetical protein
MTYPVSRTLIASLSGLVLLLAAGETFAAGPGAGHGGAMTAHPAFRSGMGRNFGHHRGRHGGAFWPGYVYGDGDYGSAPVEPGAEVPSSASGDVHYTYTYDVPWDQVHRFPPNVVPSNRPYVQECTTQTVTVSRSGGAQTSDVNITRCY